MTTNTEYYEKMLKNNICEVQFHHNIMCDPFICTMIPSIISYASSSRPKVLNSTIQAWDIKAQKWFGFQLSQLKSFKLLNGSLFDIGIQAPSKPARSTYATVTDNKSPVPASVMTNYADKRTEYVNALTKGVCTVKFIKADGTERTMHATLEPNFLKSSLLATTSTSTDKDTSAIKAVDVDINEWRTFKVDKVVSFTIGTVVTNTTRDAYVAQLQNGPCTVTFTKADGSTRVMNATLVRETIESLGLSPGDNNNYQPDKNDTTIRVVDLDAKAWRSFRVDSVISFVTQPKTQKRATMFDVEGV